jgi:hypothetical protein
MSEGIQFDLFKGRQLRNEGVDTVVDNAREEWKTDYYYYVENWFESLPIGTEFLGEEMRAAATRAGIGSPHHPNAWSGMSRSLTTKWHKEERVTVVGYEQSKSVANCAHTYKLYKKIA